MMMCNGRIPNDEVSIGSNISATSFTQSSDVLEPIMSAPQYKTPKSTFADDVAFIKGTTDDEFFYYIPDLYTH